MPTFKDSHEAAYRRLMRGAVRKSPMTKGERDVTLAMLNVWFHHRNGPKKYIHPSREALAKKAGVSVRTVATVLSILRDSGALIVMSDHLKGGQGRATRYRFDDLSLLAMCGLDMGQFNAAMSGGNRDIYRAVSPRSKRFETVQKLHTVLSDVEAFSKNTISVSGNVVRVAFGVAK